MKIEAVCIKDDRFRVMYEKEFRSQLDSLHPGKYRMTVQKYRKDKSNSQLGYYYACVLPMSWNFLLEAGWEFKSLDEVDAFWKSLYADQEIVNRDTAEVLHIPALKRKMTTTEMSAFTNAIRNHCAEYLNGYIPEPEEQINMNFK